MFAVKSATENIRSAQKDGETDAKTDGRMDKRMELNQYTPLFLKSEA